MKRSFLLTILFFQIGLLYSADYSRVDEQSHYVPFELKTPIEIAKYLSRNLQTDEEKVRAIYFWIANNIRYDVEQIPGADYRYHVSGKRNFLKEVLNSHKGVCQHYAELFDTLCHSLGVKSYFIVGYTRYQEEISVLSHAWNAVLIKGQFYDLDVTWSAGYIEDEKFQKKFNDNFFMVSPSKFITSHIPFDPVWQFLNNPITNKEIEMGDFSKLKIKSGYNFTDSINTLKDLSNLEQRGRENLRISKMGFTNALIRNYAAQNQQFILNERYNQIFKSYNKTVESFTFYIHSKYKKFDETKLADDKISEMIATARQHLSVEEILLNFLNSEISEFNRPIMQSSISSMQSSISRLKKNIDDEDEFVKKYIITPKPLRLALFYKSK